MVQDATHVDPGRACFGQPAEEAELDGAAVDPGAIPLADDGKAHEERLVQGARNRTPARAVKDGAPAPV